MMKKLFPRKNSEEGVAILLSVMIISAIAVITTYMAVFIMQEIRANRGSYLTEPAIVAAESATEQGIYVAKSGVASDVCSNTPYTGPNGATAPSSTRMRTCLNSIPATLPVVLGNPVTFRLYDPADVNGNLCMETDATCPDDGGGSGDQLYSSLIVRHVSGASTVTVNIVTLDNQTVANQALAPGNTGTYNIPRNILNSTDERLKITLSVALGSATVEVSSTGVYGSMPDYRILDSVGCVSSGPAITNCDESGEIYKRRIITVPR
jgi:hypothetical protein